ncbi:MAG: hypothetical protein NC409_05015 [Clostridium sp.]|nr:hypothetical protein [Clostridium sp.]
MKTMGRICWKHVSVLLAVFVLSACGSEKPETSADLPENGTLISDDGNEEAGNLSEESGEAQPSEPESGEQSAEPAGDGEDGAEPPAEDAEDAQPEQPVEGSEPEGRQVVRSLSEEEWEQIGQDEALIMFHSGDGGYYYVDPAEETIYYREIYAHERVEGSEQAYFRPAYSAKSDETLFAPGGTDESGRQLYDVYYGKELLINGLAIDASAFTGSEYPLDVCYDAQTQEVLLLTYHKDAEKKEEGFMIYSASLHDTVMQPIRFYPVLTGEDYQEFVYADWVWSAMLTPEAVYYDILPMRRIDMETGEVTEWGLTKEAYTETTGIEDPMRFQDTKTAGDGYIMTIVVNPDPTFEDVTENTINTYLIYTEDGNLAYVIPNVY